MTEEWKGPVKRLDEYTWMIPQDYKHGMLVPGIIFADEKMMRVIAQDQSLEQVANVACLPGIVRASYAMPDIHWGYGFAIGGVAATRVDDGVISPGGVGFDIDCGVRMLRTNLQEEEVRPQMEKLIDRLFLNIPSGVGTKGKLRISDSEVKEVLVQGAAWAVKHGLGELDDLEVTEENGVIDGADVDYITQKARERGQPQLGTLGSGNHFLEVQAVQEIYEPKLAAVMGIHNVGQVTVLIHTGSRGLGHQICEDFLKVMVNAMEKYNITLPDRQLACAPIKSKEGQEYLGAMRAGANFAWCNRQCIAHWTRESFERIFSRSWQDMGMYQIYDVAHNIAKIEEHEIDGKQTEVCVHRKGATRAFPPGSPFIPARYRNIGQPVLVPGDMSRYSYIGVGTQKALDTAFGSTCHGAGRVESREASKRAMRGVDIKAQLKEQGIVARAATWSGLAEEAKRAYKDVADVVSVAKGAGLVRPVARMRPLGVIKG